MAKKKSVVETTTVVKEPKIKVTQCEQEGRVPFTKIVGEGVCIECEQGYVQVVDCKGIVHLAKEINKELIKLTEGKVGVSDKGTFVLNGVDTDELKAVWY